MSDKKLDTIILYDLEYTTFDEWAADWGRKWPREIVQIGALKCRADTLEIVEEFEQFVKPTINSKLSARFVGLTGIGQAAVDMKGVSFREGLKRFWEFCDGDPFYSFNNDAKHFVNNAELLSEPIPSAWPDGALTDIRPWIVKHAPETAEASSGNLVEALGLRRSKDEHNGVADARSLQESIRHLIVERKAPNPFVRRPAGLLKPSL